MYDMLSLHIYQIKDATVPTVNHSIVSIASLCRMSELPLVWPYNALQ